jgi:serine protease Do
MNLRVLPFAFLLGLSAAVAPAHAVVDAGIESLRQTSKAFAAVARSVSPSVVNVQVESRASSATADRSSSGSDLNDLFRRFFGDQFQGVPQTPRSERHTIGQGSGFIFRTKDDKAYILTNYHVVEDADRIQVKLQDGREFDAKVTGRDPQSDIAVIEIAADSLKPLPLGDSSQLDVGEWVVALGNPFGLSQTLTVGVVSATGRTSVGISDYEDFIQTDAAINPGNSGGPLANLEGEVVGMNTAIFSRSGGYMGVGFAIPINLARAIADQLIDKGTVTRGFLGVLIQPLTPELADSFGIEQRSGILIAQVSEGSPADKAGLRQGDVVVGYRGKPISDVGRFRNQVSLTAPGSREELTILRDGKRKDVTVTIGTLEGNEQVALGPAQSTDELGLTVQTLTPQLAEQLDAKPGEGVVVTSVEPDSAAADAGLQPGTLILEVNQEAVKNAQDFARRVEANADKKRLLLLVRKDDMQRYVALSW